MNPDSRAKTALQAVLDEAIAAHVFPGAALVWRRENQTLCEIYTGTLADEQSPKVHEKTVYDLASLAKIYLLGAVFRSRIALETPVSRFLPQFPHDISLSDCLRHASGIRLHLQTLVEAPVGAWLDALANAPRGEKSPFYCCSNAFLVGQILVKIYGQKLENVLRHTVLEPANLTAFFEVDSSQSEVAPTETVNEIHDEAARIWRRATRDFAGNAGIFARACDVANFGDLWRFENGFFDAPLLERVGRDALSENAHSRGLGWQIGARFCVGEGKFSGDIWSHLGFTGPLLAVHPPTKTTLVILCNRVFPTRNGPDRLPYFRRICEICFAR